MSSAGTSRVRRPRTVDATLVAAAHRLFVSVVSAGGAVGWDEPPTRAEVEAWLHGVMAGVVDGDASLVVVEKDDADLVALGAWVRVDTRVHRHTAELVKVMTHPDARGRGLGRLVTTSLVAQLPEAGVEIAVLAARGNNERAIGLYESLGFREYGRIPEGIRAHGMSFDDVRMLRVLPPA